MNLALKFVINPGNIVSQLSSKNHQMFLLKHLIKYKIEQSF